MRSGARCGYRDRHLAGAWPGGERLAGTAEWGRRTGGVRWSAQDMHGNRGQQEQDNQRREAKQRDDAARWVQPHDGREVAHRHSRAVRHQGDREWHRRERRLLATAGGLPQTAQRGLALATGQSRDEIDDDPRSLAHSISIYPGLKNSIADLDHGSIHSRTSMHQLSRRSARPPTRRLSGLRLTQHIATLR